MLSSLEAALREADDRYAKHEFDSSYYTCLWTAVHTQDAQTDAGHGQATAPALFVQSRHTASHACRADALVEEVIASVLEGSSDPAFALLRRVL